MRARRLAIQLGPAVVLSALTAVAALAGSAGSAPAATAKSPWHLFPGAKHDSGHPLLAVGWASDRVWIVTVLDDPVLASSRVSASAFTSLVETRVPTQLAYLPIVDGQLVFGMGGGLSRTTVMAPLLANGRLGAARDIAEDLDAGVEQIAPKLPTAGIIDGVRVGDRVVWALGSNRNQKNYYLACCTESGAATDLSQSFARKSILLFFQLDVDTRGRIWLAWLDTTGYSAVRGIPRLLELDPSTLAARSKALAPPGLIADKVELACAASCRLVAQSAAGDIVSWGPGERSPTRIASHFIWPKRAAQPTPYPAWLLAASYRSGASWWRITNRRPEERLETRYGSSTATPAARGTARGSGDRHPVRMAAREALPAGLRPGDRCIVRAGRSRRDRDIPIHSQAPTPRSSAPSFRSPDERGSLRHEGVPVLRARPAGAARAHSASRRSIARVDPRRGRARGPGGKCTYGGTARARRGRARPPPGGPTAKPPANEGLPRHWFAVIETSFTSRGPTGVTNIETFARATFTLTRVRRQGGKAAFTNVYEYRPTGTLRASVSRTDRDCRWKGSGTVALEPSHGGLVIGTTNINPGEEAACRVRAGLGVLRRRAQSDHPHDPDVPGLPVRRQASRSTGRAIGRSFGRRRRTGRCKTTTRTHLLPKASADGA